MCYIKNMEKMQCRKHWNCVVYKEWDKHISRMIELDDNTGQNKQKIL